MTRQPGPDELAAARTCPEDWLRPGTGWDTPSMVMLSEPEHDRRSRQPPAAILLVAIGILVAAGVVAVLSHSLITKPVSPASPDSNHALVTVNVGIIYSGGPAPGIDPTLQPGKVQ